MSVVHGVLVQHSGMIFFHDKVKTWMSNNGPHHSMPRRVSWLIKAARTS